MAIFVPKKINIGFQNRSDTYTGKLAYVIYFDEKGKLRKETSWQNWRSKDIPNEIYENEPTEGFVLNKKVGGDRYSWNPRRTYTRVYDPRGFEFEITIPNLLWILENCNCIKGKGLEGQFVYGWDGKDLVLVPVDSPDYQEIQAKNEVIHNNEFIKPKDLIVGATYENLNGTQFVYMGKFKPWFIMRNYYNSTPKRYSWEEAKPIGYEYPVDDTWKRDIFYGYGSFYNTLFKYCQKDKNEFFFIQLGNPDAEYSYQRSNSVIHMPTVNKKFAKVVSIERPDYTEMFDLLNHSTEFSPRNFDADKIVKLPYDVFVSMAEKAIEKSLKYNWNYSFAIGQLTKDGCLDEFKIYYDKGQNKFYIEDRINETYEEKDYWSGKTVTKTRTINKNKYFDTLEECYKYTNPMYGEIYLTNGYLERRKYYGTEE